MELRILNELCALFSDLRIVKELAEYRLRSFGWEPIDAPRPRGICKDVQHKELREEAYVSARKERVTIFADDGGEFHNGKLLGDRVTLRHFN
jgi:hypothetical protein